MPLRSRLRIQSLAIYKGSGKKKWLFRTLAISLDRDKDAEYRQLLEAVGVQWGSENYRLWMRVILYASAAWLGVIYAFWDRLGLRFNALAVVMLLIPFIAIVIALFDKMWLEAIGKYRRHIITKEIYAIGHQLLYYSGARMNLHAKLVRCIPFTSLLRDTWLLLIQEWYEDPEEALVRFKHRAGTDEAYSFAETLHILRMNEHENYYDLLRQRIRDYKEKLEMAKESRKESFSYILFILAGIPILNTFRVFMHPWVEEGRRLFESLN